MNSRISDEEFVNAWNSSLSLGEVSKKTGYAKVTARKRAYRLGLPCFPKQLTDAGEFLAVWNSHGAERASAEFGITKTAAISLAYRLRKKGHDVTDWRGRSA